MPKITPALTPGHSVPSRSKNLTPRNQPIASSTGNAPTERLNACSIGGTSGNTSFTAIWLNPQLRHSISIKAMAPGVRARPAEEITLFGDIYPRGRLGAVLLFWFSSHHVIASEAKQSISPLTEAWIASSLRSLAQTLRVCRRQ